MYQNGQCQKKEKRGLRKSGEDKNRIFHNNFKRIARKDWKAVDALAYYLHQNIPVKNSYDLIEIALEKEMEERKTSITPGNNLMKELKFLQSIHNVNLTSQASQETSPVSPLEQPSTLSSASSPSSAKVADLVNKLWKH